MEDVMEDFLYGTEYFSYGMENVAFYGIWEIYVPFHSILWQLLCRYTQSTLAASCVC